jgi:hypothetical protein
MVIVESESIIVNHGASSLEKLRIFAAESCMFSKSGRPISDFKVGEMRE